MFSEHIPWKCCCTATNYLALEWELNRMLRIQHCPCYNPSACAFTGMGKKNNYSLTTSVINHIPDQGWSFLSGKGCCLDLHVLGTVVCTFQRPLLPPAGWRSKGEKVFLSTELFKIIRFFARKRNFCSFCLNFFQKCQPTWFSFRAQAIFQSCVFHNAEWQLLHLHQSIRHRSKCTDIKAMFSFINNWTRQSEAVFV